MDVDGMPLEPLKLEQELDIALDTALELPEPPESPKSPRIPPDATRINPIVRFSACRFEPELEAVFLQNKARTTIGSAAGRAETDLHLTGCKHATSALLTTTPTKLEIKMDDPDPSMYELKDAMGTTLYVSNRMRINVTTSRVAVAIDGTIVNTMSGQASKKLDSVLDAQLQRCSTILPVTYANWLDFNSVIEVSNFSFVNPKTNREYTRVILYDDEVHNEACKRAEAHLEALYTQATSVRQVVVFEPAPPLSKSVMRVPVGINASSYDLCSSVVSRPPSLARETFEALMAVAVQLEASFDDATFERFKEECAQPGLAASRWSQVVANALSTVVSLICPYRIDGRTQILPNGMQMTAAESWKAEASRTALRTADDCDGSMAHVTSTVVDARLVAASPDLAHRFPVTACTANALSLHLVGGCVLAANAGNASAAGQNGDAHVAGHAIALLLPRSMVFEALTTGALAATANRSEEDSNSFVESLQADWFNAMFSAEELAAFSDADRAVLKDMNQFKKLHTDAALGQMEALAVEGTSPVSPSLLFSRDNADRLARRRVAIDDKRIARLIGPSVARSITQLDVGAEAVSRGHVFYNSLVEFLISPSEELFRNRTLRERGKATSQFVLTNATNPTSAGAEPRDVATSNFGLLPLFTVDTDVGNDLDVALAEVQKNTLPRRAGVTQLDARQSEIYKSNLAALSALHEEAKVHFGINEHAGITQFVFAYATLFENRHSVAAFVTKVGELAKEKQIAVSIDQVPVDNVVLDVDGASVGKVVIVNVELLV